MNNKNLDEITEEVLRLYDEDRDVEEIVNLLKIKRYLVESILVTQRRVYFR